MSWSSHRGASAAIGGRPPLRAWRACRRPVLALPAVAVVALARRECYIGLCYGQPGVGKTLSARRYSCWHELGPLLQAACHHFTEGRDRADWHTLLYTPTVSVTPRMVDKELTS